MKNPSLSGGWMVLLPVISALLLELSFPTVGLHLLAWIALVPLLVALRGRGPAAGSALSFVFGTIFAMIEGRWFLEADGFELLDLLLFGLAIGFYFVLLGLAFSLVARRKSIHPLMAFPFFWVSLEYLRLNAGFLAFPGLLLAHSQYTVLPVIQIASFTGVYGVSFLVASVNALIAEVVIRYLKRRSSHQRPSDLRECLVPAGGAVSALFLLGFSLCYGFWEIGRSTGSGSLPVTVIQGNIPQDIKWNPELREVHLSKHIRLTQEAAGSVKTELIVWPETSVQGSLREDPRLQEPLAGLAREVRTPLLVGSAERVKFGTREMLPRLYNSAFLLSEEGWIEGEYRKILLLPFAEYVPHAETIRWPVRFLRSSNYFPGTEYTLFDLKGIRFAALICWESCFPGLVRKFAYRGADFLVNITNEAWFGESAGSLNFLALNVFRTVENRLSLVRAGNTGISCFIDPYGRLLGKVEHEGRDIFVEGQMTREVPLPGRRTFYTRHGDLFAFSCLAAAAIIILVSAAPRWPGRGERTDHAQPR